ncbi:MAG: hypothetical protein LWX09_00105 [Bacteroidia bacterium]|jgi:hypothetical protein|nr:hypothetical protein [Bacteroidia bacterium]
MDYQITVKTDESGFRAIEHWVDQIADYYNLGSSYYGALSVLFDGVLTHFMSIADIIDIHLIVDDNGLSFSTESKFSSETQEENKSNDETLIQLLEQLSSSFNISPNSIEFRLASDSMPQEKVKNRQNQLNSYLKNGSATVKNYDNFSRS